MIYVMCIEVFFEFYGNVYLIDDGECCIFVDCGFLCELLNKNFVEVFVLFEMRFGYCCSFVDIDCLFVIYGYMDYFGGLCFVCEYIDVLIGVYVFDWCILLYYEECVVVVLKQLVVYLCWCGFFEGKCEQFMVMYKYFKFYYCLMLVDFLFEDDVLVVVLLKGEVVDLKIGVIYVFGYCFGQVCLWVDDYFFMVDYVFGCIMLYQVFELIMLNMGFVYYFELFDKIVEQ